MLEAPSCQKTVLRATWPAVIQTLPQLCRRTSWHGALALAAHSFGLNPDVFGLLAVHVAWAALAGESVEQVIPNVM